MQYESLPEETNWLLPKDSIDRLQQASIERLIEFLKWSQHCDVIVRKDGADHHFEAEWIKNLVSSRKPPETAMPLSASERNCLMKSGKSRIEAVSIKLTSAQVERLQLLLNAAKESDKFPHPQDTALRELISAAARRFWAHT